MEPAGLGLGGVRAGERVGRRTDTVLGASSLNHVRHVGERGVDHVVDVVVDRHEERHDPFGELVDRPAVVAEVLHVLLALEPDAAILLALLGEVLVGLDGALVGSQSDDLTEHLGRRLADRVDGQVRRGDGVDLGQELGVDLDQLPRTLEGAEVARRLSAGDVAILEQLERRLGASALLDQVVDEDELHRRGDEQEALAVAEVAVEPVVRELKGQSIERVERIGVIEEHALDGRERRLDLVVVVLARLGDPLVVRGVAGAGDHVNVCGLRTGAVSLGTGDELAGHVTGDRGEQAVLVVVAQHGGLHLPADVLLHDVLDRGVAELLVEDGEAEAAVTRHGVLAPEDRRNAVLPLGGELGAGVVIRTDTADLGVDDVVVNADVGNLDRTRVRVRLDLVAGEHAGHRGRDSEIRCQSDLVVGQAVLLDWCDHEVHPS